MFSVVIAIAFFGCVFAAPPDDSNCGVPAIAPSTGNREDGRIVGGKEAKPNSWPWQVQIRYNGGHFCGASMVSRDWIVSAAHCFRGFSASSFSFRFGRHTKSGTSEQYEQTATTTSSNIVMHESYSPLTSNNDIAVIRVSPMVTYSNGVSSVCLPQTTAELAAGTNVHVTGWGETENTGTPNALKQVMVPIVSRSQCNQADYYNGAITTGMICAGLAQGGLDSCQGDSGGPLVYNQGGRWRLFGVVSWGVGCAEAKKPGVYANVVYYESWVRSKVKMVEREEQLVSGKFRPAPFGAAFREQARELVLKGEVKMSDLPLNGEWLE